jgi:hypothetical protein
MLTDETLRHIALLFPRIKKLVMWGTRVTKAMAHKMQQEEGLLQGTKVMAL